ncbi:MAG: host attachment protein [Phycisphaerales bacterium]|nr:host attachment protein [Phycisphaerales bacterium]
MTTQHWALLCDERGGRLVCIDRTASGHPHVTERDRLTNTWEPRQHTRPSPLGEKDGHTNASWGHEDEMQRKRFAKEIGVWVEQLADELSIDRLAVFAPPKFLGVLRDSWSPKFAILVSDFHGELTGLSVGDLEHHASIVHLLSRSVI